MRILTCGAVLVSAAALMTSAACGSSGGKAAASPSGSAASIAGGDFAAYAQCLRQHGVNIPTAPPGGQPSGPPGRRFGGLAGANREALQACRSLAPRPGGRGMQELQAFRSCMKDHGVSPATPSPGVPRSPGTGRTPGAFRSPGSGLPGRLNTSDPKVAKALKICRPLLPTPSPRPSPG